QFLLDLIATKMIELFHFGLEHPEIVHADFDKNFAAKALDLGLLQKWWLLLQQRRLVVKLLQEVPRAPFSLLADVHAVVKFKPSLVAFQNDEDDNHERLFFVGIAESASLDLDNPTIFAGFNLHFSPILRGEFVHLGHGYFTSAIRFISVAKKTKNCSSIFFLNSADMGSCFTKVPTVEGLYSFAQCSSAYSTQSNSVFFWFNPFWSAQYNPP